MYISRSVGSVKHSNYRAETSNFQAMSGTLRAHRSVNKEVADICFTVLRGLGNAFPAGFNVIELETFKRENEEAAAAETVVVKAKGTALVKLGLLPVHDLTVSPQSCAELALAFTHEVVLHAIPDLIACSQDTVCETEDAQHRNTYVPSNEDNVYHQTVKKIANYLPADMKKPFLMDYAEDVYEQLYYDTHPTDQIAIAGYAWVEMLRENAKAPLSSFWRN